MSSHHSKEFFELIRAIGETKSKQEEDKIISQEVTRLKTLMKSPKVSLSTMKEYIIRMLYCEMLGHEANFGYIHAVNLTSSTDILQKRVGYLGVTLCLHKQHELLLLIIAVIQKDLKSTNYLEVCAALDTASKIATEETIPALLEMVLALKNHPQPIVRKKVAIMLRAFDMISPGCVSRLETHAKELLCDHDPSVMGAALNLFLHILETKENLESCKVLTRTFVDILKQIVEHALSNDYDYHRLPAPWMQMKLLKILAILGKDDKDTSEIMYPILRETLQRADIGLNIGSAIMYEAIRTITTIYPNPNLIEMAAAAISRFITSADANHKYLGIQALKHIVTINPKYATQHQTVVIECLEDEDEAMKRVTLELLFTMTNPKNADVIIKKLLTVAKKSIADLHLKTELVNKIAHLAENFALDTKYYIDTMMQVFEFGIQYLEEKKIQYFLNVIAEGGEESSEEDEKLRIYCVEKFFDILTNQVVIHDLYLQVIGWVLGEYGYLSEKYKLNDLIDTLCDTCESGQIELEETRSWLITAITKLTAQLGEVTPNAEELMRKYASSKNVDIQQRAYEFLFLSENPDLMERVLPQDGSAEQIEIDPDLSFLDSFVEEALKRGARRYVPEENRGEFEEIIKEKTTKLKTKEYQAPSTRPIVHPTQRLTTIEIDANDPNIGYYPQDYKNETGLNTQNLRRIWKDDDDDDITEFEQKYGQEMSPNQTNYSYVEPDSSQFPSIGGFEKPYTPPTPQRDDEPKKKISAKTKKLVKGIFNVDDVPQKKKKVGVRKKVPKKETTDTVQGLWGGDEKEEIQTPMREDPLFGNEELIEEPIKPKKTLKTSKKVKEENLLFSDDPFSFVEPQKEEKTKENTPQLQPQQLPQKEKSLASALEDFLLAPAEPEKKELVNKSKKDEILEMMNPLESMKPIQPTKMEMPVLTPSPKLESVSSYGNNPMIYGTTLCKDSYIHVTYDKSYPDEGVHFTLFISTERGFTLTSIVLQFQPPQKVQLEFESPNQPLIRDNSATFAGLEPGSKLILKLKFKVLDFGFGTQLMGSIAYTDDKRQRQFMNIHSKIDILDLIRPHPMKTNEFGSLWKTHTHEKRIQIKGSYTSESLADALRSKLKAHVVQTIGSEIISSLRIVSINRYCLLHTKAHPSFVVLTVRSQDRVMSDLLCREAQIKLQI